MQKILLVDDSDVVLEANRMILEDSGYGVIALDNPYAVPYVVRKEKPDLVLIDVNMPTMMGDVVVQIVSQHGITKSAPILLFSNLPEAELAERVKASGASGYIRKDGNREAFVRHVKNWLGMSRPAAQ